jgi:hypothetical protein
MVSSRKINSLAIIVTVLVSFVASCALNDSAQFYISKSKTKTTWQTEQRTTSIPFSLVDQKILIPISINDSKPLQFVLDTGSPVTVIVESHNTKALPLKSSGKISVGGLGDDGDSSASFIHNTNITVGSFKISEKSILHIPLSGLPFFDDLDEVFFDGIIGFDLLAHLIVKIDYDTSTITLFEKESFDDQKYTDEKWSTVALDIKQSVPFINSKVRIKEDSTPMDLILHLDTGAAGALSLAPRRHDEINFPTTYYKSKSFGISGGLDNFNSSVASASIGNIVFTNMQTDFSDSAVTDDEKHHGSIGNQLFSQFNVIFDYQDKRMLIKENHRFNQPILHDRSGLGVLVHKNGYVVKRIDDDTGAIKTQLALGDVITQFNGLAALPENIEKFRQALSSNANDVQFCWISEGIEQRCDRLILEDRIKDHGLKG